MIRNFEQAKSLNKFDGTCGTYVSVVPTLSGCKDLVEWSKLVGVPMSVDRAYELHCTVMWSKQVTRDPLCDPQSSHQARLKRFDYWDGHDGDGYIVAIFDSPALHRLHRKWVERGCKHSFPDYTPHVTLATKLKPSPALLNRMALATKELERAPISFFNEQIENIKP